MYIKIIKATLNTYWYATRYIGKVFEIVDIITTNSGKNFVIRKEDDYCTFLVAWDDCVPSSMQEYIEQEKQ